MTAATATMPTLTASLSPNLSRRDTTSRATIRTTITTSNSTVPAVRPMSSVYAQSPARANGRPGAGGPAHRHKRLFMLGERPLAHHGPRLTKRRQPPLRSRHAENPRRRARPGRRGPARGARLRLHLRPRGSPCSATTRTRPASGRRQTSSRAIAESGAVRHSGGRSSNGRLLLTTVGLSHVAGV